MREGRDVTVVALALMVHQTLAVCERTGNARASRSRSIDPRTVSPLDIETILQSVAQDRPAADRGRTPAPCGFGAEIAAQVADAGFDDLDAPIRRLNGVFTPTPYSPPLEAAVVPHGRGDCGGDSRR